MEGNAAVLISEDHMCNGWSMHNTTVVPPYWDHPEEHLQLVLLERGLNCRGVLIGNMALGHGRDP